MSVPHTVRRLLAAALVPIMFVALAACGSDPEETAGESNSESPAETASEASSASATSAETESAEGGHTKETLLPAMKAAVQDQGSAHVTMELAGRGQEMSAEGDVSYDSENPSMRLSMSGAAFGGGDMELRMVEGVMYLSIPPMTPTGKYLEIDPDDPNNPLGSSLGGLQDQMDPLSTFDALEAGLREVTYLGEEQMAGETLHHYRLTVDAAAASKAQGQTAVPGMPETIEYDLWLDDQDLMRKVSFDMGRQVSLEMSMSDWGKPVTVEPPAAQDIMKRPPGALGGTPRA